jgi:hypothetical protein
MKSLLLLILCLLISQLVLATDTTYYESGEVKTISSRNSFYKSYYKNGQLASYKKEDSYLFNGRMRTYDSLGNIVSKGKIIFSDNKQGRWMFYENGKKKIVKYKYGEEKSVLKTPKGKRVRCLLTYGYFSSYGFSCDSAAEKYRVYDIPIAGCSVTSKLVFKADIHNFFVQSRMFLLHGKDWEEDRSGMCRGIRARF